MANVLIELDQLNAIDPRVSPGEEGVAAMLSAGQLCISTNVLPAVEVEAPATTVVDPSVNRPGGDPAATNNSGEPLVIDDAQDLARRRSDAIAALISFGRSIDNATCVVDQLIEVEATEAFDSPQFGLGLDPNEATAFAVCL